MAVRKKREVGAGDALVDGYQRAVVFEGAVGRQRLNSDSLAGVVWVRDHHATAIATNSRHGAATQGHGCLAFNQDDVAASSGCLIDRRDVHHDVLESDYSARPVIHSNLERVCGGGQHLISAVLVNQLVDATDGEGGPYGYFVAIEQQGALCRRCCQFDDDLRLAVIGI